MFLSKSGTRIGLVVTFLFSLSTALAEEVTLYVVDYPPYTVVDKNQKIKGTDSEVVIAALATQGIDVTLKSAPWKRIEKNLKYGRVAGTLTCSYREHRTAYITYSNPISSANQAAIASKKTDLSKLKEFQDLNNYKIITIEGWGIQKELENKGIQHTLTNSIENALNAVLYRGVDIFYGGEETTLFQAKELGVRKLIQAKRIDNESYTDFYLCLSSRYPGTAKLKEDFNKGLNEIKNNGLYEEIHSKYLQ